MGMLKEFREFALKGNFVDMAVGIVVGGAVGSVVGSIVNDLITPIVSMFTGGINFSGYSFPLTKAAEEGGKDLVLTYGNFIQTFINFLILMFVIFVIVKVVNTAKSTFEKEKAAAPPPEEIVLLRQIRDSLAGK